MIDALPPGYRIESRDGARWFRVYGPAGGRSIASGPSIDEAVDGALRAIKRASRRPRPCICCGKTILSEGPHHRMCRECRIGADELVAV